MVLFEIRTSKFSVCALGESQTDCELSSFFSSLDPNQKQDERRMLRLLKRVADRGADDLNTEICHQIEGKLYQFRQGQLRVLWFYDQNRIVICTHGFFKKTRKTPEPEKHHAKEMMQRYFQEKERAPLTKISWGEERE